MEFLANLLNNSGYTRTIDVPNYRVGLISRFLHYLAGWLPGVNTLESIRNNPISREFSLHSIFDKQWQSMTSEEILDGYFQAEYLLSLNIELPHIDLLLNNLNNINDSIRFGTTYYSKVRYDLLAVKQLISYSIPSQSAIDGLLKEVDRNYERLGALLIIFQYRRELMEEHMGHPLIKHLFEISHIKDMKSARSKQ